MQSTKAFNANSTQKELDNDFVKEFSEEKRNSPRDTHKQPVRVYLCNQEGQLLDFGWAAVKDVSAGGIVNTLFFFSTESIVSNSIL